MAEAHEPLETGTPPDGNPLPVQSGNICSVGRPLHKQFRPAVALVDWLWLATLGVVEKDLSLILIANDELVSASSIHAPLMQIFLHSQGEL